MAKESMKAREVKRAKLVAKYAEKRKALKEAGDYEALQKLPKNDVLKDTCVHLVSHVSFSVKWLTKDLSQG